MMTSAPRPRTARAPAPRARPVVIAALLESADDLILALRAYASAERRLLAIDDVVGRTDTERFAGLARLEFFLARLERERGV
jgi:hypothetical protein